MALKTITAASLFIASLACVGSASAQTRSNVQAGTLSCDVSGGLGLIVTSNKALQCIFERSDGRREAYVGNIRRIGLDIGATTGGRLIWSVVAPGDVRAGALAGDYVGASGEATVGAGVGANALIGGFNRSVSLQPLSVQGQTGLNLAAGVADMRLTPAVIR